MKLAVQSSLSLAEQEKLIRKIFAEVPNQNLKVPDYAKIKPFKKDSVPSIVEVEPLKDIRSLDLSFHMPSMKKHWKSKPGSIIGHIIGHEGEGSLLSYLKNKGWVTTLGTGLVSDTFASQYRVNMTLTDEGVKNTDEIINTFFSYVNLIKGFLGNEKKAKNLYLEQKALQDVNYFFGDYREGASYVSALAGYMHTHPGKDIEKNISLIYEFSPKSYQEVLSYLKPENLLAVKTFKGAKQTESSKFFNAKFGLNKVTSKQAKQWTAAKPDSKLQIPAPNKYVPSDLSIYASKKDKPKNILKAEGGEFWYQQDSVFKLPKAKVHLRLLIPDGTKTARKRLMLSLYASAITESLNEWRYPALVAGYSFDIGSRDEGISINLKGFSEKLPTLVEDIVGKLKNITISEKRFKNIKDEALKSYKNQELQEAYRQAFYEIRYLMSSRSFHINDFKKELSKITLADLKKFANEELFQEVGIMGSAYGNLKEKDIKTALTKSHKILSAKKFKREKWNEGDTLKLKGVQTLAVQKRSLNNNNAWVQIDVAGPRSSALEAELRLADSFIGQSFFTELRTKKQLGYIVNMSYFEARDVMGFSYVVQSSKFTTKNIFKETEDWRKWAIDRVSKITDKEFEHNKKVIISNITEPYKNIDEAAYGLLMDGFVRKQMNYKKAVAEKVKSLDKKEFTDSLTKLLKRKKGNNFVSFIVKKDGKNEKVKELNYVKNNGEIRSKYKAWRD